MYLQYLQVYCFTTQTNKQLVYDCLIFRLFHPACSNFLYARLSDVVTSRCYFQILLHMFHIDNLANSFFLRRNLPLKKEKIKNLKIERKKGKVPFLYSENNVYELHFSCCCITCCWFDCDMIDKKLSLYTKNVQQGVYILGDSHKCPSVTSHTILLYFWVIPVCKRRWWRTGYFNSFRTVWNTATVIKFSQFWCCVCRK